MLKTPIFMQDLTNKLSSGFVSPNRKRGIISLTHLLIQAFKIGIALYLLFQIPYYYENINNILKLNNNDVDLINNFISLSYDLICFAMNKLFIALFFTGFGDLSSLVFGVIENTGDVIFLSVIFNVLKGKDIIKLLAPSLDSNIILNIPQYARIYNSVNQLLMSLLCLSYGDVLQASLLFLLSIGMTNISDQPSGRVVHKFIQKFIPFILSITTVIGKQISNNLYVAIGLAVYVGLSYTFRFGDKISSISFLVNLFLFCLSVELDKVTAKMTNNAYQSALLEGPTTDLIREFLGNQETFFASIFLNGIFANFGGGTSLLYGFPSRLMKIQLTYLRKYRNESQGTIVNAKVTDFINKDFSIISRVSIVIELIAPLIIEIILNVIAVMNDNEIKYNCLFKPGLFVHILQSCLLYSCFNEQYVNDVASVVSLLLLCLCYTQSFVVEKPKEELQLVEVYENDQTIVNKTIANNKNDNQLATKKYRIVKVSN